MKSFLLIIILGLTQAYGQVGPSTQWTWMKGDNFLDAPGVYGTQQVFNNANKPGARDGAVSWTDVSGNFWLFGGNGFASSRGLLNDLWKYDPSTNRWSWMQGANTTDKEGSYGIMGISDPLNSPGGRSGAVSWSDPAGNLWLFGGEGYSPGNNVGFLNDLWKYSIATNEWTWIAGDPYPDQLSEFGTQGIPDANNKPGSRRGSVSWIDASGKLWLFGGLSYDFPDPAYSNDLWKFDPLTSEWTWLKGSFILNQPGMYGNQGVSNLANNPGGRADAGKWLDASGNFWLFGGLGFDESAAAGFLNDMWRYSPATNTWTWFKGDKTINQTGSYGSLGVASTNNTPGARHRMYWWKDGSGILWMFGGEGYGSSTDGLLYDLWRYNTSTNLWTWIKGDGSVNQNTVFGTQGNSTSTTRPGSRRGGVSFTDPGGNLWLFGGNGYDATGGTDLLNDLWKLGTSSVVPVRGLKLFAQKKDNEVLLQWITEQELNTDQFIIERSSNGLLFNPIGTVAAAGNSSGVRTYRFTDLLPLTDNFYRISMQEVSGNILSNIVNIKETIVVKVFPNPAQQVLYLQSSMFKKGAEYVVTAADGRNFKKGFISENTVLFSIDIKDLAPGFYVISLNNGIAQISETFLKN